MSEPNSTKPSVSSADHTRQAYILQRISSEAQKRLRKSKLGLMNETINPLWNIDARQAQLIYDFARSGNYAQIQYLYEEIESKDPTLGVCVTRRTSAVAELDWRVVRSDQRINRNADQNLIDEQIEFIETAMAKIDNLPDALEHLALSAFRGFSVVAPVHGYSGEIKHLDLIDGWNLCLDRLTNQWLFNPTASSFFMPTNYQMATTASYHDATANLQRIPPEQICVVTRRREIDWPAMQIYLRCTIGERDWGRFLETYGLPPVIITMPEFTSEQDQASYIAAAEAVFEGRSGVVPNGSEVNYASESRGTNPFTEFIEHQQKLIVMMATGGTLATLAESGTGTLAGDAQQDEWMRIIRADKRLISNAINKQICERLIRSCKDFKGMPILAEFQLDDTPKPTPKEMLELAGSASSAGFEMDADELSQAIGYKLTKKVDGGGFGGGGFDLGSPSVGAGEQPSADDEQKDDDSVYSEGAVVQNVQHPSGIDKQEFAKLCRLVGAIAEKTGVSIETSAQTEAPLAPNAGNGSTKAPAAAPEARVKSDECVVPTDGQKAVEAVNGSVAEELAKSLQHDFQPVADRLVQILALPENERAGAAVTLLKEIDKLVPEDPAMASVIAEQMQEMFDKQVGYNQSCIVSNSNGQTGDTRWVTIGHAPVLVDKNGNPVQDHAGAVSARKTRFPYESDTSKWPNSPTSSDIQNKPYREFKKVTADRLENAVNKAWCEGVDVKDAATVWYKNKLENGKSETVVIDIDIGAEDINGAGGNGLIHIATDHTESLITKIPSILAYGKYYKDESESGAFLIVHGNTVLSLKRKDNGKYRIASCYDDPKKSKSYTQRGGQVLNFELAKGE